MQVFVIILLTIAWVSFSIYRRRRFNNTLQNFKLYSETVQNSYYLHLESILDSIQLNLNKISQKKNVIDLEDLVSIGELNIYTKTTYFQYINPKTQKIYYVPEEPIFLAQGISLEKEDIQKLLVEKTSKQYSQRASFLCQDFSLLDDRLTENKFKASNR